MPAAAETELDLRRELDRYLRHLTIERGLSAHTVAAYRRDLDAVLERLRGPLVAQTLRDALATDAPRAATSAARAVSSVRGFTRFLVEEGRLDRDPGVDLVAPKLPRRLPKALSIDQVTRLLEATAGEDPVRMRDRALLELLYATGARVSEVTGLDVDDLLAENGPADVVRLRGKGDKERLVPVGSYARDAVDAYLVRARPELSARGRTTPALFLGARGARLSRQSAFLVIREAAERAHLGIEPSPHSLRHSFATHLLQGGADVRVVQELLGHANVATTQIYTAVTADSLRDAYLTAHPRAR